MSSLDLPWWVRARASAVRSAARALIASGPIRSSLARRRAPIHDGRAVEPEIAAMLALDEVVNRTETSAMSVEVARRRVREQVLYVGAPAVEGVTVEERTVPGADGRLLARFYTPRSMGRKAAPAIVFFHGGGWVTCDVATHDGFCRELARGADARVMSVDYRLSPEHRFPAAIQDACAATRWVLEHAESLGIDPARVAVAGDSAGGNLSAVVARHLRHDARKPSLQVLIYPATDATLSSASQAALADGWLLTRTNIDWYLAHYAPGVDKLDPDLSPLHAPDVSGCAKAIVITAGLDPLRDEGQAYAEKLRTAGVAVTHVEHEGLVHGFIVMGGIISAAARAVDDLGRLVRSQL